MKTLHVAIIGSHGLYANYGGWDQLVNNLAEKHNPNVYYTIYNSRESQKHESYPIGVNVIHLPWKASGAEGMIYDIYSIIQAFWKADVLLLLGVQGMPILFLLFFFRKIRVIGNVGGVEWERPKFNILAKLYLKFCFNLAMRISDVVILDNKHYAKFLPRKYRAEVSFIPYGGVIDQSLEINQTLLQKYPFLGTTYYLSVSRSISDNQVMELCDYFADRSENLVMISNFSRSDYGKSILKKHGGRSNLILIDGLYKKDELDLIRVSCRAYIHTHTLCGTAPSLVEMIMSRRPIISVDIPQNRFTMDGTGFFYKNFSDIDRVLDEETDLDHLVNDPTIMERYEWSTIIRQYESLYDNDRGRR